ncbi:alpha-L-fucosidase [Pseudalgibacter alginicilyticus]|uniref:Alpha-L-fucosidase n=1 Tax=Pseudalgibacter alginicilyticus TaxID=1736674 RepID=A0A0P0D8K6_9FLAO|nr:glycoside hydrolase family 95 protein [Pseudalgibacter alginicilyticus]ALJ04175.1 alpha-L-fucosidase [Pseudalgibacter alginicilyticus]
MKTLNNTYIIKSLLLVLGLTLMFCAKPKDFSEQKDDFKLVYTEPAEKWTDALPIGNGSLGAMVFGGVAQEHIQFNEETLWRGQPHDYAHEGAGEYLAEIRQLLTEGKSREAHKLAQEEFMSEPLKQVHYQPFGDIYIDFKNHENYTNYKRELNLNDAISSVSYTVDDANYTREILSSFPDQIIAINLTVSKEKALNFDVWLDAIHDDKSVVTSNDSQTLVVKVKGGVLRGVSTLKIKTDGSVTSANGTLQITNASKATMFLSAATNYIDFSDVSGNPETIVPETLSKVENTNYKKIKLNHIQDYQALYNRFEISFGDNGKSNNPTNQRILDFSKTPDDPHLVALYVEYARYLTISSSRPGTKPATLQGIWNDKLTPPWFSSYTTNINLEMNYWPVEMYNLSECHEPLFDLIEDLSITGAKVAKEHYNADGWIVHHNIDIWRGAAPVNASHHGIWLGGAAWLSTHIWEHYLYTQDKAFLEKRYPLMRNAAVFYSQFLYEDPNTGYLISSPSNSPEIGGLVAGPTMDHQLIRALFRSTIEASKILGADQEFTSSLQPMISKIAPNKIGKHGQLQEWMEDKDDPENHHRHVSHLWAVHPGNEINYEDTPDLMKAAKQSLEYRGDNGTGWSLAWKINFWSRFKDGNHAYKLLHKLLSPAEKPDGKVGGGSYPNLFDAHPPFQIDGNFGGASGILEMILQSHLGKIELLPALPDALPRGYVSGIVARGGFELNFSWENSELKDVEILSKQGGKCTLSYRDKHIEFNTSKGKTYKFDGNLNSKP